MPFAASISTHPDPRVAVGEVAGDLLERLGEPPDVAVAVIDSAHLAAFGAISDALRTVLRPGSFIAVTSATPIGGTREAEAAPAISLWAALVDDITPALLRTRRVSPSEMVIDGLGDIDLGHSSAMVLFADPFSFPADAFVTDLHRRRPELLVVGGLLSGAPGPGGNRLRVDDEEVSGGAVALVVGDAATAPSVTPVVSQGCVPIGDPMVVTAADGRSLLELAGRPALDRLEDTLAELDDEAAMHARRGLHIGVVVDETQLEFATGDFVIRAVTGVDRGSRSVQIGEQVEVGTTVQFQVRSADAATQDLWNRLLRTGGDGALLFTCTGRGERLFGVPDHDAGAVVDRLGTDAVAGMSCAGEIGPVGGVTRLHGFTASIAVFTDPQH